MWIFRKITYLISKEGLPEVMVRKTVMECWLRYSSRAWKALPFRFTNQEREKRKVLGHRNHHQLDKYKYCIWPQNVPPWEFKSTPYYKEALHNLYLPRTIFISFFIATLHLVNIENVSWKTCACTIWNRTTQTKALPLYASFCDILQMYIVNGVTVFQVHVNHIKINWQNI